MIFLHSRLSELDRVVILKSLTKSSLLYSEIGLELIFKNYTSEP